MAPSNYLERQQLVYDCMLFPKTWKNENLHIYSFWLFCMDADLLLSKPTHQCYIPCASSPWGAFPLFVCHYFKIMGKSQLFFQIKKCFLPMYVGNIQSMYRKIWQDVCLICDYSLCDFRYGLKVQERFGWVRCILFYVSDSPS